MQECIEAQEEAQLRETADRYWTPGSECDALSQAHSGLLHRSASADSEDSHHRLSTGTASPVCVCVCVCVAGLQARQSSLAGCLQSWTQRWHRTTAWWTLNMASLLQWLAAWRPTRPARQDLGLRLASLGFPKCAVARQKMHKQRIDSCVHRSGARIKTSLSTCERTGLCSCVALSGVHMC